MCVVLILLMLNPGGDKIKVSSIRQNGSWREKESTITEIEDFIFVREFMWFWKMNLL